jgi:hypothetical protein
MFVLLSLAYTADPCVTGIVEAEPQLIEKLVDPK